MARANRIIRDAAEPVEVAPAPAEKAVPPQALDDATEAFVPDESRETRPDAVPKAPRVAPAPKRRKGTLRRILFVVGPVAVIAGALYFYLSGGRWASTDDAYVKADIVTVATDVSGTVAKVAVHNDQHVRRGDLLFQLDDEPYRLAVAAARADLAAARNQIASFQQLYRNQLATVDADKADVRYYETAFQRATDLVARQAGTQATLDQARRDLDSSNNKLNAAQMQANSVLAYLGGKADGAIDEYPQVQKAQAQLDKADRDLRHTAVRAPADGVVTNVDSLQPGNYLPASMAAFSLVASDHVWVEGNFKETDLTYVRAGNPADIAVDTYPDVDWKASVDTISPATGAQFSVLPAQNSSGNWVKVVQRIPVRLKVMTHEGAPTLRAGMSVVVDIDTGHQRSLAGLVDGLRRSVGL